MSKYSLQYRAAQRRALKSPPLTTKSFSRPEAKSKASSSWQSATYSGFDPMSGKHVVHNRFGEVSRITRIPGYGAEFGGASIGSSGLFSQGFWSN